MDPSPRGRRGKPPRFPPTKNGTLPPGPPPGVPVPPTGSYGQSAPGPRPPGGRGRIVCFAGPKEGVGKSTIALNLALAWAGTQSRNVLIVQLDPLCRNDLGFMLGLQPPTLASLAHLAGQDSATLGRLLKARVPVSQWGVGLVSLGRGRGAAQAVTPKIALPLFSSLNRVYDLFLDVDPCSPLQPFAFLVSDVVFWACLPHRAHLEATYNAFQELEGRHFPRSRFEVVVNECDVPGALAPREVDRYFQAMNQRLLSCMPWEGRLPEFANSGRILVLEQPHSDWVKAIRPLLGRVMEIR